MIEQKQIGDYAFMPDMTSQEDYIGQGSFGSVFKGFHTKTKEIVAVKVIPLQFKQGKDAAIKELKLYTQLEGKFQHENILKIYKIYQSTSNKLYIIMEMCSSGNLEQLLKQKGTISEKETIKVMKAAIEGVACLNDYQVIHRDIKPANILINKGVYKIGSYGLSKVLQQGRTQTYTQLGTPLYQAPEITFQEETYGFNVDTFSIGITLYECLYGQTPWPNVRSINDLRKKMLKDGKVRKFPNNPKISEEMKRLIQKMTFIKPFSLRPNCKEMMLDPDYQKLIQSIGYNKKQPNVQNKEIPQTYNKFKKEIQQAKNKTDEKFDKNEFLKDDKQSPNTNDDKQNDNINLDSDSKVSIEQSLMLNNFQMSGYKQVGKYVYNPDTLNGKDFLGKGAFGKVFKGFHVKTRELVAIKVIALSSDPTQKAIAEKEINFYKQLGGSFKHDNVLKIHKIYKGGSNKLYIVMEMCQSGDLKDLLGSKGKLSEEETIKIMKATIEGLAYLNDHQIMHRDIKPANLLIDKGVYKICDYGFAKILGEQTHQQRYTLVGTPFYQAPEISKQEEQYGYNVDTFSTGIMIYQCLYGKTPWPNVRSIHQLVRKMEKDGKIKKFPNNAKVSDEMKRLIQKMTLIQPYDQRPNPNEVIQDPDYQKLINKIRDVQKEISQQKDPALQQMIMFDYNAQLSCSDRDSKQKDLFDVKDIDKYQDDIQPPKVQFQMKEQNNPDDELQKNFNRINRKVEYQMLKVQLAVRICIELKNNGTTCFKENEPALLHLLQFVLAKYQCIKMTTLKTNFYSQKSMMGEPEELWQLYICSQQYSNLIDYIAKQSRLSNSILEELFKQQLQENIKSEQLYFHTQDQNILSYINAIFNQSIQAEEDLTNILNALKYCKNQILSKLTLNNVEKNSQHKKLQIATYLMQVYMYEYFFVFNPNNSVTYQDLLDKIEKYGEKQMMELLQFNMQL